MVKNCCITFSDSLIACLLRHKSTTVAIQIKPLLVLVVLGTGIYKCSNEDGHLNLNGWQYLLLEMMEALKERVAGFVLCYTFPIFLFLFFFPFIIFRNFMQAERKSRCHFWHSPFYCFLLVFCSPMLTC